MHVLIVPAWYPSREEPVSGVFIRNHVRAVAGFHDVTVLAPPSAAAPPSEVDDGLRIVRLPAARGGGRAATLARLRAMNSAVARLQRERGAPVSSTPMSSQPVLLLRHSRCGGEPHSS